MNTTDAWKALVEPGAGALVVRDQSGFAGNLGLRNGDRVDSANGVRAWRSRPTSRRMVLQPLTRSQPVWLAGQPRRQAAALALPERGSVSGLNAVLVPDGAVDVPTQRSRQPIEQRRQCVDAPSAGQLRGRVVRREIAVAGDQRFHAGGDAARRCRARHRRRRRTRAGIDSERLGRREAAAPDAVWRAASCRRRSPRTRTRRQARDSSTSGSVKRCALLVTMPQRSPRAFEFVEHRVGAVEQPRLHEQAVARSSAGMLRAAARSRRSLSSGRPTPPEQPARTVRGVAAQRRQRQRRQRRDRRARD